MGKYSELLKKARDSVEYWTQNAMRKFVGETVRRMNANNISRADLAAKLDVSPAYVTKILRGDVNFTLETMVKLARAVGGELQVGIVESAKSSAVTQSAVVVVAAATKVETAQTVSLGKAVADWHQIASSNDHFYKVAA